MNNNRRRSPLANKEELEKAVESSRTMTEVLEKMGLRAAGGNFRKLHEYANEFGIELPEVDSHERVSAARFATRTPDHLVFCENSTYENRPGIKARLIGKGFKEQCAICGLGDTWNGSPLTLQLDHINGRSNDNRVENLRFLCPNCHAQTETYRGRNIKPPKLCPCGAKINARSTYCRKCAPRNRYSTDWPPIEHLVEQVQIHGYCEVGRQLGVSDNAVRKHIKKTQNV